MKAQLSSGSSHGLTLYSLALSFDWLTGLSVSFVIGQSDVRSGIFVIIIVIIVIVIVIVMIIIITIIIIVVVVVVVVIIIIIIIIIYIILWRNSSHLTYDYILELFGGQTCKSRPRYVL